MKWHKDDIWLSNKSISLGLFEMISVDLVRDDIMYWLTPIDVLNFVIATGIMPSCADMCNYTNLFRYFLRERAWIIKKLNAGYNFTILSPTLSDLVQSNFSNKPLNKTVTVALLITKNEMFVPCTEEFAHKRLFLHPSVRNVVEGMWHTPTPEARVVRGEMENITFEIVLPIARGPTSLPMFLSWGAYQGALCHDEALERETETEPMSQYAHMTAERGRIVTLKNKDAATNPFFSIQSMTRYSFTNGPTDVVYRLNKLPPG